MDGRGAPGRRRPPLDKKSLIEGRGAEASRKPGRDREQVAETQCPAQLAEARMRSRRSPWARCPKVFMVVQSCTVFTRFDQELLHARAGAARHGADAQRRPGLEHHAAVVVEPVGLARAGAGDAALPLLFAVELERELVPGVFEHRPAHAPAAWRRYRTRAGAAARRAP